MSCDCSQPGLMPVAEAARIIAEQSAPVTRKVFVSLSQALGRMLASDVISSLNVPPSNNSAMDGYGFRYADLAHFKTFTVAGESFAGTPFNGSLNAGECIRIMTGAVVPSDVDTVIMQEQTTISGNQLTLLKLPKLGANIRVAGEDIAIESQVYQQGHRLSAVDIGVLAAIGLAQVEVFSQPRVGLFSTGDELRQPGERLEVGQIYDSNRHFLLAMLAKLPVEVVDFGCLPDQRSVILTAVQQADEECDVVISSGGVSVGEADYTREVLDELGIVNYWKLAMKPGKPFAFGELSKSRFFGLPGNPVSAMVTFHQLVVPALRRMSGYVDANPVLEQAIAGEDFSKSAGRTDYQRGVLSYSDGRAVVHSSYAQGSGMLSSMARANCYIVLEQDRGDVVAGETVDIMRFDQILN